MELIPKALVVGVFVPPAMPGQGQVTADKLNRIWSDVAPSHGYTQFQMSPDQSAANFLGASPEIGVTIQPPLLQVRDLLGTSGRPLMPDDAASRAEEIIKTIARNLGVNQFFNLGIKIVYHAAHPANDARGFILNQILSHGGEGLGDLSLGGDLWGGVKFVTAHPDGGEYTLQLEPVRADDLKSLFIDVDAQYPGPATPDAITARAREAHSYVTQNVNRFLDRVVGS